MFTLSTYSDHNFSIFNVIASVANRGEERCVTRQIGFSPSCIIKCAEGDMPKSKTRTSVLVVPSASWRRHNFLNLSNETPSSVDCEDGRYVNCQSIIIPPPKDEGIFHLIKSVLYRKLLGKSNCRDAFAAEGCNDHCIVQSWQCWRFEHGVRVDDYVVWRARRERCRIRLHWIRKKYW